MKKYLALWYELYLSLIAIRPSEAWLHVRLDVKPVDKDTEKREVRIRVASKTGPLIHDEIRAVIDLVDSFMEERPLLLQTEILNNGIEIVSEGGTPNLDDQDQARKDLRRQSLINGDVETYVDSAEDRANAIAWLEQKGAIGLAVATAGPDFVAGWLAEAAFGPDVRVALADGRTGIISGFLDDENVEPKPSRGFFLIEILSLGEESHQALRTGEVAQVPIGAIAGVISYDNDELRRGNVEPLEWQS